MTSSTQNTGSNGQPPAFRTSPDIIAILWRALSQPALLLILGTLALLLILGGLMLPQLPGQLNDEPAAATRWLLTTSSDYGPMGPLLHSLGMFHVLHSPALRLLLAMIGLILCVQFADSLGAALNFSSARTTLASTPPRPNMQSPLPVHPYQRLYRHRFTHPEAPATYARWTEEALRSRFQQVQRTAFPLSAPDDPSTGTAQNGADPGSDVKSDANAATNQQQNDPALSAPAQSDPAQSEPAQSEPLQEVRLLALHNERAAYMRPLLSLGLLVALVAVWIIVVLGWQIATPTLVPGERYRSVRQDFSLAYDVMVNGESVEPVVEIGYGSRVISTTVASSAASPTTIQPVTLQVDSVNIDLKSGEPALLLHSANNEPAFALPGQSRTSAKIGLSFPAPGSEETVIIPDQSAGLRIVRRSGVNGGFLVELYQGEQVEPVERLDMDHGESYTLAVGEDRLEVEFVPVPGIQAEVRYLPGTWLLGLAGLIALLGLIGAWRDASFILVQIRPWSKARSLIIAQSTSAREMEFLHHPREQESQEQDPAPLDDAPEHIQERIQENTGGEDSRTEADSTGILKPEA